MWLKLGYTELEELMYEYKYTVHRSARGEHNNTGRYSINVENYNYSIE